MSAFFNGIDYRRNGQAILGSLLLVTCLTFWTADVFAESSVSQELKKHAPTILDNLRARNCANIGVLKFRVQMAGETPSDNVGTFNLLTARRLENALALVEADPQKPIRLVRDASSVAASTTGTTHLSSEGRDKLFGLEYPAAWGAAGEKLKVDAFVTGLAKVDANLQTLQLCILGVFPQGDPMELLAPPISCPMSWDLIPELGKPFTSRGPGGAGAPAGDAAREAVELRVYYDGQPVNSKQQDDDGVYLIPEPKAGQKVALELWRSDNLDHVVGAVLKVNGENTAFNRQQIDSSFCHKWVLKPQASPIRIEGYQMDTDQRKDFRVATPEESRELEMNYGSDVGMITLELFRQARTIVMAKRPKEDSGDTQEDPKKPDEPEEPVADSPDIAAIEKGYIPPTMPSNHEALQTQLRFDATKLITRGIITDEDETTQHKIKLVDYDLEEQPFQSLVLRYYKPGRKLRHSEVAKEPPAESP